LRAGSAVNSGNRFRFIHWFFAPSSSPPTICRLLPVLADTPEPMRVAILEDDAEQAALMRSYLTEAGHDCQCYSSGKSLIVAAGRESFDLFVLDWQVPDLSGEEVLRWVRQHVATPVPVMFVTNRDSETDIVSALEQGADEYMKKPISRPELLARIGALLRRAYPQKNAESLTVDAYSFDLKHQSLSMGGSLVELTQKEFDLALFLFQNLGRLLSRGHILGAVWGRAVEIPSRTMDTHVSRIRTKLNLRPESGFKLTPVYNYGYRLEQLGKAAP
jgi:two-component system, OmpR family, response regulator RegX3